MKINYNGQEIETITEGYRPEDDAEPAQRPMTASDLLAMAQSTYPPTQIVLRAVCKRIGTASQVADELRLGERGARTVRKWISDPRKVPFSVWFTLLAIDEDAHAAND